MGPQSHKLNRVYASVHARLYLVMQSQRVVEWQRRKIAPVAAVPAAAVVAAVAVADHAAPLALPAPAAAVAAGWTRATTGRFHYPAAVSASPTQNVQRNIISTVHPSKVHRDANHLTKALSTACSGQNFLTHIDCRCCPCPARLGCNRDGVLRSACTQMHVQAGRDSHCYDLQVTYTELKMCKKLRRNGFSCRPGGGVGPGWTAAAAVAEAVWASATADLHRC